ANAPHFARTPNELANPSERCNSPPGSCSMSWTRRPMPRLLFELLEDRLTPSWAGVPPSSVTPPASFTAVTLDSNGDASGPAAITTNEVDWYKVTVPAGGTTFRAGNGTGTLDTVIGIFSSSGQRLAYNDDAAYPSNLGSQVTVTLAAGTYYLGVTNYTGAAGGSYTWS